MKPNLLSEQNKGPMDSEDERWIRDMLALVGQTPKATMSDRDALAHNERMIHDFINFEGIFAEGRI